MAEEYKVLGQSNPAATTSTDVYTVPSGKSAVISTVTFCNRSSSSSLSFRFSVASAGAALSDEQYTHYNVSVPPYDALSLTIGMTLGAADVLRVYTDNATLSVNVFGTEIS